METSLTLVERAKKAIASEHTDEELKKIAGKYSDVTSIKDKAAYEMVKRAALDLTKVRTSIEKASKAARDDANAFNKAVITEERRLIAIIKPEEDRLKNMRQAVDDEIARRKREREEAERKRIEDEKRAEEERIARELAEKQAAIDAEAERVRIEQAERQAVLDAEADELRKEREALAAEREALEKAKAPEPEPEMESAPAPDPAVTRRPVPAPPPPRIYPDLRTELDMAKTAIQRLFDHPTHTLAHADLDFIDDVLDHIIELLDEVGL